MLPCQITTYQKVKEKVLG